MPSMLRFGVPALVLAVAALAGPAAGDTPTLQASVGPGFTISLKDASGALVTHLDPGEYTIHVDDQSDIHNFDLIGPGVSQSTGVADVGSVDWQVTFTNGTYAYVCDVHASTMHGSFTVGTVAAPAQTLAGGVGPGKRITLARRAKAGKAILTIRDRSTKDNFHLAGPGVNKKTGVKFTGTVKWTVTLKSGLYTFRSDTHKTLRGTLNVS
jgi:plastocyanin